MTPSIGLDLRIETPENVVLTYQLAGPALRAGAYAIDFAIRMTIFITLAMLLGMLGIFLPGLAGGMLALIVFVLEWGYTIGFEYAWQGRTPGKMAVGLRVIQENGQPLSWWSAALRNLLRVADTLPLMFFFLDDLWLLSLFPVYGPGLISMICSPRLQRLGDLAARTVVIQERRARLPHEPEIFEKIGPLARADWNSYTPQPRTLSLIERFMGRRTVLLPERGHALARPVAAVLAERLNFTSNPDQVRNYPMAFLARVYETFASPEDLDADLDEVELPKKPKRRRAARAAR